MQEACHRPPKLKHAGIRACLRGLLFLPGAAQNQTRLRISAIPTKRCGVLRMIFPTIVSFRHRGLSATAPDGSFPNAIPERGTATACPSTVAEAPRLALSKGARATFAFKGTAAKWIGYKDPWSGIASVYMDGVLKTQVDSYSASGQAQQG